MPSKKTVKEVKEPTRQSSRVRGIGAPGIKTEPDQGKVNDVHQDERAGLVIPSIVSDRQEQELTEEEEDNTPEETPAIPTTPAPNSEPENNMTAAPPTAAQTEALLARITQLEANSTKTTQDARGITPANSAFGGDDFKPTGFAAWPVFTPYGNDQTAINPHYDKKARKAGVDPCVFSGNKEDFDKWIIKVADKFDEDNETFRKERSRMAIINSLTQGNANDLLEARYRSTEIPFKSAAEMIATLSAIYHDDNQGTNARDELRTLKYDPRDKTTDIHQFIGKINSLADKANISKDDRKMTLYEHIPADLDPQLLGNSKDPLISYESFANKVADSALSQIRGWEERRERREKRPTPRDNPSQAKSWKKEFVKTTDVKEPTKEKLREEGKCYLCRKEGHIARNCPEKANHIAVLKALLIDSDPEDSSSQSSQSSGSEN